ncbi:MAG: SDR family oxidoreductase, partial [Rhodothermales bacterium]
LALISRDQVLLEETSEMCQKKGAEARIFVCNVTDEHAVNRMAAQVRDSMGVPDVLVNNAGIFRPGDVQNTGVGEFRELVEVNLTSAFIVTHAFLDAMVSRRSGHLFYMCSVASVRAYPGGAAYCAAKHGLLGLSRAVREETKELGIRVTAVIPGATYTRSWKDAGLPEERFMAPEDIGRIVVDAYRLSARSVIEEVLVRPQLGDI